MGSASAADTWRDSGVGGERPPAGPQVARRDLPRHDATPARAARMSLPPVPPPPPRGRPAGPSPERRGVPAPSMGTGRPVADSRPPAVRPQQPRTPHPAAHPLADRGTPEPPPRRTRAGDRPQAAGAGRNASRGTPAADRAPGLRGAVAVLGVFVITLAGGAVDSFLGIGLGTLTLVTLVAASAVGTLLVRKRDLVSLVVAPPLVFVLVALVNIGLAPSASFNLPTLATILIRGFPTMVVATVVAAVVAIVRWAARR